MLFFVNACLESSAKMHYIGKYSSGPFHQIFLKLFVKMLSLYKVFAKR